MNLRSVLLIVVLLLIGAFAALNWSVLLAPTDLSLGIAMVKAPLGLILLGLMVLLAVAFLIYIVVLQAGMMAESRRIAKELKAQLLSLIHISEPTRLGMISYAVFCLK